MAAANEYYKTMGDAFVNDDPVGRVIYCSCVWEG